jgi:Rieske Fe-S protein
VAARNRSTILAFAVTLDASPSGRGIAGVATPIDDSEMLVIERSTVFVSLWREGPSVIRGTIKHASGAVAHFQGAKPLAEMARLLHLDLQRRG